MELFALRSRSRRGRSEITLHFYVELAGGVFVGDVKVDAAHVRLRLVRAELPVTADPTSQRSGQGSAKPTPSRSGTAPSRAVSTAEP